MENVMLSNAEHCAFARETLIKWMVFIQIGNRNCSVTDYYSRIQTLGPFYPVNKRE